MQTVSQGGHGHNQLTLATRVLTSEEKASFYVEHEKKKLQSWWTRLIGLF